MKDPLHLLVIEDSESDTALVVRESERIGCRVQSRQVSTAAELRPALESEEWDLRLSDDPLPQLNSPAALQVLPASGRDIPFIAVSGSVGEKAAVALMRTGAQDFILQENLARLVPAAEREVEDAANRRARRQSDAALRDGEARFRLYFAPC